MSNWEKIFDEKSKEEHNWFNSDGSTSQTFGMSPKETKEFIREVRNKDKKRFLKSIGSVRQWLNEDRITNPDKMVSNEDLLIWFK